MSPLKYVDLLVLAAALAVFVLAELPMVGYAAAAAAWLAQRVRSAAMRAVQNVGMRSIALATSASI